MELQCNKLNETTVFIETSGRMDAAMAPNFEAQCRKWMDNGSTIIIADLENWNTLAALGCAASCWFPNN